MSKTYHFRGNDSDLDILNDTDVKRTLRNKSKEITIKINVGAWDRIKAYSGLKGDYTDKTILTAFVQNALINGINTN
jgi:hypothetical protein